MTLTYSRFDPPRRCEEYIGQAAPQGGMILPPAGYDAIAASKTTGLPNQLCVRGGWRDAAGSLWLDLAVTTEWLIAATNYRPDDRGHFAWICPECERRGGGHAKSCGYEL